MLNLINMYVKITLMESLLLSNSWITVINNMQFLVFNYKL